MPPVLSFGQCFLELCPLLVPQTYISPSDKTAREKDNRQKDERHPQPNTGKNQKAVEAAQSDRAELLSQPAWEMKQEHDSFFDLGMHADQ